jgi:hypothetical protein
MIEETKNVRDSSGIEEKLITRTLGEKSHIVIERKLSDGSKETEEVFHNFDESGLEISSVFLILK